ncbi:MAG: adenylosuccinate synthase [Bacteroidales bacterium]|nr:adenylosuccinate synthase [Bacteroidales bacterium]
MQVDVLLGLQWGDEGKGKIVDVFTPNYDVIARFQGGPNAGHTLEFQGSKHVLHHIPSGVFRKDTINLIGNGVILDPMSFKEEIKGLEEKGIETKQNLYISNKAHLILPTHRLLDLALERQKGKQKIGSTLKGIGPTYTDKVARTGIRIGDIISEDFHSQYNTLKEIHLSLLKSYGLIIEDETIDQLSFNEYEAKWMEAINLISEMKLVDSENFINQKINDGKKVLAEGAQGTLLDIDFGSYPFVTSSNTITAGVCAGLGIAPSKINRVYGVFKAYCTRVGSGPFPTELNDDFGQKLRDQGNEYGATTGRPRRCGWLDLPALKYAIMLNGVTDLVMTKADVFTGFQKLSVCRQYMINNKNVDFSTFNLKQENLECYLHEFEGWNENINQVNDYKQLPANMKKYLDFIENDTGTQISVISTSADRTGIIFKNDQMFN